MLPFYQIHTRTITTFKIDVASHIWVMPCVCLFGRACDFAPNSVIFLRDRIVDNNTLIDSQYRARKQSLVDAPIFPWVIVIPA